MIFRLDFGTIPTVWYFLVFHLITENTHIYRIFPRHYRGPGWLNELGRWI